MTNQFDCQLFGYSWFNDLCSALPPSSCSLLEDFQSCRQFSCFWYDSGCHSVLPTETPFAPLDSTTTICARTPDFTVSSVTDLQNALSSVQPGGLIKVLNGTYLLTTNPLTITTDNVTICGEDRGETVIATSGSGPQYAIQVNANGAQILQLTINHRRYDYTQSAAILVADATDATRLLSGFLIQDVNLVFKYVGMWIRASDWTVNGCDFRHVGLYSSAFPIEAPGCVGTCTVSNNRYLDTVSGSLLYSVWLADERDSFGLGWNVSPADSNNGKLVLANNTQVGDAPEPWLGLGDVRGTLLLIELFRGSLELSVTGNDFGNAYGFVLLNPPGQTSGEGDMLTAITIGGNTIRRYNQQGLVSFQQWNDGVVPSFRTNPIPISVPVANVVLGYMGELVDLTNIASGYTQSDGSVDSIAVFQNGAYPTGVAVVISGEGLGTTTSTTTSTTTTTTTTTTTSTTTTTTLYPPLGPVSNPNITINATLDQALCGPACYDPVDVLVDDTAALGLAQAVLESIPNLPPSLASILSASDPTTLSTDDQRNMKVLTGMAALYGGSTAVYVANILGGTNLDPVQENVASLVSVLDPTTASDPATMAAFASIVTGDVAGKPQALVTAASIISLGDGLTGDGAGPLMRLAAGVVDPNDKKLENLGALVSSVAITTPDAANALIDFAAGTGTGVWGIVGKAAGLVGLNPDLVNAITNDLGSGRSAGEAVMTNILVGATQGKVPAGDAADLAQKCLASTGTCANAIGFAGSDVPLLR